MCIAICLNCTIGLYVSGSEKPIIVGHSRMINCSSHLNVSLLEWILVGIQDDPVEKTMDTQSLTLTVSPEGVGLDGTMFTCRATTYGGRVFEETVTIQVKGNQTGGLVSTPVFIAVYLSSLWYLSIGYSILRTPVWSSDNMPMIKKAIELYHFR